MDYHPIMIIVWAVATMGLMMKQLFALAYSFQHLPGIFRRRLVGPLMINFYDCGMGNKDRTKHVNVL